jgi:hypothetical protein
MLQVLDADDAYVCGLFEADANPIAWEEANLLMRDYLLSHIRENIVLPRMSLIQGEMRSIAEELLIPKPKPTKTQSNPTSPTANFRKRRNTDQKRLAELEQKERAWDEIQEQATPSSVADYCSVKWVSRIVPSKTGDFRDTLAKCFGICIQKFGVASKLMMDQINQVYDTPRSQRRNHAVLAAVPPIEFWVLSAAMGKACMIRYASNATRIIRSSPSNTDANLALMNLASEMTTIPLFHVHCPVYPNRWGAYKFLVDVLRPTTHESVYEHILKMAEFVIACPTLSETQFRNLENVDVTTSYAVSWRCLCKVAQKWGHPNSESVWALLLKAAQMYSDFLSFK